MNILPHEKQIAECEETIAKVKTQKKQNGVWSQKEVNLLEKKLQSLKNNVYSQLKSWERVSICRHPNRPQTSDYIQNICSDFIELFGDRCYRDDKSVITGLGMIEGQKFAIIGLEKGKDTSTRLERNFGMAHPEGYRKALRVMQLAEKFNIPIITFLDTPGAYPGLTAEERGQGWAIAKNLFEMAKLKTPIIAILIGEGCSGGALGIGVGDKIGMLEHAYYSVISPEGCASILWKDAAKNSIAAEALKIQAEDLSALNIIDDIIKEPQGGAHHAPSVVYENVKNYILKTYLSLKDLDKEFLVEFRYNKFRKMGFFETNQI